MQPPGFTMFGEAGFQAVASLPAHADLSDQSLFAARNPQWRQFRAQMLFIAGCEDLFEDSTHADDLAGLDDIGYP
jgi:hypothetical protein